jgi:CheY-like chemotaxis protein
MKILVAEDAEDKVAENNHILATILADYLTGRGHAVVAAYDLRHAAGFCRQRDYDDVLIDLLMPDIYGIDVPEELHQQQRMRRAIVISGFPELLEEMAPRLAAVGIDAVIRAVLVLGDR